MKKMTSYESKLKIISLILFTSLIIITINNNLSKVAGSLASGNNLTSLQPADKVSDINRTAEIENILYRVDENLLSKYIQRLQDYKTRNSYRPDKCFAASEYFYDLFQSNALNATYDPFTYSKWNMRNVIGEKRGTLAPEVIIIACAHYDTTSGYALANAPGADDNGSGVAAVLAAAEILSDYEFNYTIRFIAFSGEEQSMQGSAHYASNCKLAGENISSVINLDMIAYNPVPTTNHAKIYTNTISESLANSTIATAQKYSNISNIILDNSGSASNSDHASFWPEYKAIMLHEKTFNTPNYHKTTDTIDMLNLTYCTNITQVAVATIAELAGLNSTDISIPAHDNERPASDSYGNATPLISIEVTDPSLINQSSIVMCVDGNVVGHALETIPLGYNISYSSFDPYSDGQIVTISIEANDTNGFGFNYSWQFTIDATSPQPPANLSIGFARVEAVKRGLAVNVGATGEPDSYYAHCPAVIYHDGEYKMWYTGYYTRYQIIYANSSDGINWVKHGVVISNGTATDPDSKHAAYQSVVWDTEYKMWYSGCDGANWRIMYANSSDGITWSKQGVVIENGIYGSYSPTVVKSDRYEMWYAFEDGYDWRTLYAESVDGVNWIKNSTPVFSRDYNSPLEEAYGWYSPSVLHNATGYYMLYTGNDGIYYRTFSASSTDGKNWSRRGLTIDHGESSLSQDFRGALGCSALSVGTELKIWYSGQASDNFWRIFYANISESDNKTDLLVSWDTPPDTDIRNYWLSRANNVSSVCSWQTYVPWNHTVYSEYRQGDENNISYYYKIRAVDKVGNIGECASIMGKIGINLTSGWNLVSNLFLEGEENLSDSLCTMKWLAARTYNQYAPLDNWLSYIVGRNDPLNNLNTVNQTVGMWMYAQTEEVYAMTGQVTNISIYLKAGWNLVAYPYHTIKNVSEALAGVPWDHVERFNSTAEYDITEMTSDELMYPGRGYWVHLTSDFAWVATNL